MTADEPTADEPTDAGSGLTTELERYLRHLGIERGRSPHTLAAYRRDLGRFFDSLTIAGVRDATAIEGEHVTSFARSLRDGPDPLAASSVARMLSSVRGFTRFLVDEGRIVVDPAAEIVAPKLPDRLPKALTIGQVEQLLAAAMVEGGAGGGAAGADVAGLRDRALLELLYATGARVSEAVGLNVDDLVGDAGTTDLVRLLGKGGKQRVVPVGSYARSALDAYLVQARPVLSARGRATPALFLGMRGARLSRQNAWLLIRAVAERAQLDATISPHSLRHSFATHLLQGGADVRVVQELLGHASVATTQIYTRVTADALRDMYVTAHPRAR
ncbi:MAG: site-specific tyrosine recombinase XerD [Pseudolysinimonas sp.]